MQIATVSVVIVIVGATIVSDTQHKNIQVSSNVSLFLLKNNIYYQYEWVNYKE